MSEKTQEAATNEKENISTKEAKKAIEELRGALTSAITLAVVAFALMLLAGWWLWQQGADRDAKKAAEVPHESSTDEYYKWKLEEEKRLAEEKHAASQSSPPQSGPPKTEPGHPMTGAPNPTLAPGVNNR